MFALRELQHALTNAILCRDAEAFAGRVRSNGLAGAQRVQLYQNNVFISLTQALADVYPVVKRLVGDEYFRFMARRYIQRYPSRSGNLHDFGRELVTFLREVQDLPYLGDVAALEWAYHEVFHAGDAPPLDRARLARVPPAAQESLSFRLHPAVRLVTSRYPILAIWGANLSDEPPAAEIDLDSGADYLLVARRDLERVIERVMPGEFAFLAEVAGGALLAHACEVALAVDRDLDIGTMMSRLVADRTITGFHHS